MHKWGQNPRLLTLREPFSTKRGIFVESWDLTSKAVPVSSKSWVCSSSPKYPDSRQELIPWLHWDDSQDEFKRKVTEAVADIGKSCSPRKIIAKFYRDENGKIV